MDIRGTVDNPNQLRHDQRSEESRGEVRHDSQAGPPKVEPTTPGTPVSTTQRGIRGEDRRQKCHQTYHNQLRQEITGAAATPVAPHPAPIAYGDLNPSRTSTERGDPERPPQTGKPVTYPNASSKCRVGSQKPGRKRPGISGLDAAERAAPSTSRPHTPPRPPAWAANNGPNRADPTERPAGRSHAGTAGEKEPCQ